MRIGADPTGPWRRAAERMRVRLAHVR
jgi:hypothetical protein